MQDLLSECTIWCVCVGGGGGFKLGQKGSGNIAIPCGGSSGICLWGTVRKYEDRGPVPRDLELFMTRWCMFPAPSLKKASIDRQG